MKAQMFVVTMIFLVGLVFFVQQALFGYTTMDLSEPLQEDEYYMNENMERAVDAIILGASSCEEANERIEELSDFVRRNTIRRGYEVDGDYLLNCSLPFPPGPPGPPGPVCGDGAIEGSEVCECGIDSICGNSDDDTGGETCLSQGYASGDLYCSGDCLSLDTSGCIGGGGISLSLLYPAGDISVQQDDFFRVTLNASCVSGNCGTIEVSLDPPSWIHPDDDNLNSSCHEGEDGHTITRFLKGLDYWYHSENHQHWFIIDLDQTYNVQKVKSWSNEDSDPTDVNIYVSDDQEDWGAPVATGINVWQDTIEMIEVDVTDKNGRYVKVEIDDTENSSRELKFGVYITLWNFDVYGEVISAEKTGLVSTTTGEVPFYTNASSNPLTTGSLSQGDSELVTFWVNATGSLGDYEFFAYANLTSDPAVSDITSKWNVTII